MDTGTSCVKLMRAGNFSKQDADFYSVETPSDEGSLPSAAVELALDITEFKCTSAARSDGTAPVAMVSLVDSAGTSEALRVAPVAQDAAAATLE
jgi:hypothetical protein